jgi:MFS family permease
LVTSILAMGVLYIFLPAVKSYGYFLALHTLISVFSILEGPAESALVIDIVGENQRGKSYGKYKFAVGIGGMLGPIVGGYIYENLGSETGFYIKGIMAVVLCIFAIYYFNRIRQKDLIIKEDS